VFSLRSAVTPKRIYRGHALTAAFDPKQTNAWY
jgi:hypothetical protein